jgi:hypothetical protein
VGYALAVARLLACPFCRQLFPEGEAPQCPDCAVALVAMDKLPPSHDVLADELEEGEVVPPEHRLLPWRYLGRGRGALLLIAALGLGCFFAPWVRLHAPDELTISGFDLARGRAGWLWGGAVGWFTLLPLTWTRRTIAKLRGVRIISVLFALLTLGEVAMMMAMPPQSARYRPVSFEWGWGLYLSGVVAILGAFTAARLGGRIDDVPAIPWQDGQGRRHRESSADQTLH